MKHNHLNWTVVSSLPFFSLAGPSSGAAGTSINMDNLDNCESENEARSCVLFSTIIKISKTESAVSTAV